MRRLASQLLGALDLMVNRESGDEAALAAEAYAHGSSSATAAGLKPSRR